jgi:hypothetical protein
MRQTTRDKLDLNMPLTSRNILVELVARGGIEPPTFRFSGGVPAYTNVFQLVKPGQRPSIGRVEQLARRFGPILAP